MNKESIERAAVLLKKGLSLDEYVELTRLLIQQRNEYHETKVKNLGLFDVIHWVATKDELPKVHTKVLLYNDNGKNYALEFIHEFDLTTDRYTRNWTHWAEFKPPCV